MPQNGSGTAILTYRGRTVAGAEARSERREDSIEDYRARPAMKARLAATLFLCLVSAACASRNSGDATRQKWCGAGGGAAAGALLPVAAGVYAGGIGVVLGVALAPVGAVVGAVNGAVRNPCPDAHTEPGAPQHENAEEQGRASVRPASEGRDVR
jgi:hypothetical protein